MQPTQQLDDNRFFVYVLVDPKKPGMRYYGDFVFSCEPFYIGKGSGTRPLVHLREARTGKHHNQYKVNKINKILAAGLRVPILNIQEGLTNAEALELEKTLIAVIGRKPDGGPLTNITSGGEGFNNPTPEARKKVSDRNKKLWETKDRFEHGARVRAGWERNDTVNMMNISENCRQRNLEHIASRTAEQCEIERQRMSKLVEYRWANTTDEQRALIREAQKQHFSDNPDVYEKFRTANRAWWAAQSPEELAARNAKTAEQVKNRWATMTDEQRAALSISRKAGQRKRREREAAEKLAAAYAKLKGV
jgi:hypothetical protein